MISGRLVFPLLLLTLVRFEDSPCTSPKRNLDSYAAPIAMLQQYQRFPPDFVQEARGQLAEGPGDLLIVIIRSAHNQKLPVVNWLRSAGDEIVERCINERQPLPKDELSDLAANRSLSADARWIALQWRDRIEPGYAGEFLQGQLMDPVFASAAVESVLKSVDQVQGKTPGKVKERLLNAFRAATDPAQSQRVAHQLRKLGEVVDLHRQLGTVTRWHLIGAFPGNDQAGMTVAFPPETQVDLTRSYRGKSGEVSWKAIEIGADDIFVNLNKQIAANDDAVAYLSAVIDVAQEREVELRACADNSLALWLNGKKIIESLEQFGRPQLDKQRVLATLSAGKNTILMKVCKMKSQPGASAPWRATLRVSERSGQGVAFKQPASAN
jgi:hypothetical protein